MNKTILPLGKLSQDFLGELIKKYTIKDESVIVGAQIGEDATVIDQEQKLLIAKTDPITFVTDHIGFYAVNINANDIACMGGRPRWFLSTILLPELKTTKEMVEDIFSQLSSACKDLDIIFCGGHTEVTFGINRPIVIGQMLGNVEKESLVMNRNARPGDDILLTKGIAIEATSIIAREKGEELLKSFSESKIKKCMDYIYNPGISVLKEAKLAVEAGGVNALHDPTEGGLAMALHELAQAGNVGIEIYENEILISNESDQLCKYFDIDPLGVIASGALLIVSDPCDSDKIIKQIEKNNISVKKIGQIKTSDFGLKIKSNNINVDLPKFHKDEITKLFKN